MTKVRVSVKNAANEMLKSVDGEMPDDIWAKFIELEGEVVEEKLDKNTVVCNKEDCEICHKEVEEEKRCHGEDDQLKHEWHCSGCVEEKKSLPPLSEENWWGRLERVEKIIAEFMSRDGQK